MPSNIGCEQDIRMIFLRTFRKHYGTKGKRRSWKLFNWDIAMTGRGASISLCGYKAMIMNGNNYLKTKNGKIK